eukprot:4991070-Alexandrium_andersonii.AAC.1
MSASLVGSEMCIRDRRAFAEGHEFRLRLCLDLQRAAKAAAVGEGCETVAAPASAAEPGLSREAPR